MERRSEEPMGRDTRGKDHGHPGLDSERQLNDWPLYIDDENRISCYKTGCIEPDFIPWPRRKSFGGLRQDLLKHIREMHGSDHNRHYGAASCGRDDVHGPHRVRLESTDQWHECMGTEPQHKSNYVVHTAVCVQTGGAYCHCAERQHSDDYDAKEKQ